MRRHRKDTVGEKNWKQVTFSHTLHKWWERDGVMSLICSWSCCAWGLFIQCCVEAHGLKTKLKQHNPPSHQLFNQFNQINLYCVWELQALATESPFCADFSLFWCYNWKQRCRPRRMWQEFSGWFVNVQLFIRSCIFWVGKSLSCASEDHKDAVFTRHDSNQTVDCTRNSLNLRISLFYWGSSTSSYWVLVTFEGNPQGATCTGRKQGMLQVLASQGRQSSIWSALLDDDFGTLHNRQVPIGIFWKLVLSVVIVYKGINRVCLSGFYMCFS